MRDHKSRFTLLGPSGWAERINRIAPVLRYISARKPCLLFRTIFFPFFRLLRPPCGDARICLKYQPGVRSENSARALSPGPGRPSIYRRGVMRFGSIARSIVHSLKRGEMMWTMAAAPARTIRLSCAILYKILGKFSEIRLGPPADCGLAKNPFPIRRYFMCLFSSLIDRI